MRGAHVYFTDRDLTLEVGFRLVRAGQQAVGATGLTGSYEGVECHDVSRHFRWSVTKVHNGYEAAFPGLAYGQAGEASVLWDAALATHSSVRRLPSAAVSTAAAAAPNLPDVSRDDILAVIERELRRLPPIPSVGLPTGLPRFLSSLTSLTGLARPRGKWGR